LDTLAEADNVVEPVVVLDTLEDPDTVEEGLFVLDLAGLAV
jgi:hypothetical protein